MTSQPKTNNLDAYWMPFTPNRQFKAAPRIFVGADGMYYRTDDGRQVLDGTAGLWCCNAGHNRPRIVEAIQKQAAELDYSPAFMFGHPKVFEVASRVTAQLPTGLDRMFFTNSGSEAVETALKIANAFHRANGEGGRYRWIGRERGYHGVNYGGLSVSGLGPNRKAFGPLIGGADHLRHTHDLSRNAFTRGLPEHGAELADDLERLVVAARPVDDLGGDRRADRRLDRRAAAAEGLSQAPPADLRQIRHPPHLRRGDHRFRPPRHAVRG